MTRTWLGLAVGAWAACFAALLLLSLAAHEAGPIGPDLRLARQMQRGPGWFEPAADLVRLTGERLVANAVLVAVGLLTWTPRAGRRSRVTLALAVLVLVMAFVQAELKQVVDRPRPDPALIERRSGFDSPSFPSGHVLTSVLSYGLAAASLFARPSRRAWAAAAVLLVPLLLNMWANTYLGVHWPTDSAGGVLTAVLLGIPVLALVLPRLRAPAGDQAGRRSAWSPPG